MFMPLLTPEVIRFGKLFPFGLLKSCPFWKTRIGCKGTKFPNTIYYFKSKKNIK
jgi:hypothetical protein